MSPFEGIPLPSKDRLSLYVIGPGFGESSVTVLPDGKVVVVDSCMEGDLHLTLELLDNLTLPRIDLLLVTHADLDHVRGIAEMIGDREVALAWRYPGAADVRTLAAKWLRGMHGDTRLEAVRDAMDALDRLAQVNACVEACADVRSWPDHLGAPVRISCLAPSQHDQLRNRATLDGLIQADARGPRLADQVTRFFDHASRGLGRPPNVLSLAAAIEWTTANIRILLNGDVERGDGSSNSGWNGILSTLEKRGSRAQIQAVRAVKVAHHGSRGAFEHDAWDEHVGDPPDETWAIIAPFRNGGVILPDLEVLRDLNARQVRLAICDTETIGSLPAAAGWRVDPSVHEVCDGPVVCLQWEASGLVQAARGRRATAYTCDASSER